MRVNLENRNCPKCGATLKKIVYGMITSDAIESGEFIIGGCEIDGTQPWLGCEDCDFRGFPGGRTFRTSFEETHYEENPSGVDEALVTSVQIDLMTATEDELWLLASRLFEARLELLHRGVSKRDIEIAYEQNWENWIFMPFEPFEEILVHFSRPSGKVLGVTIYFAHEKFQHHMRLILEDGTWGEFPSWHEFRATVLGYKSEGLETWVLEGPEIDTIEAYGGSATDLNSEFVRALIARKWRVDPREFPGELSLLDRPILWPYWYER